MTKWAGYREAINTCLILTAIWMAMPVWGYAQEFSIIEYEVLTISGIDDPATTAQDSLEVITNKFHFFGAFPLIQKERFRLFNGLAYDFWSWILTDTNYKQNVQIICIISDIKLQ